MIKDAIDLSKQLAILMVPQNERVQILETGSIITSGK